MDSVCASIRIPALIRSFHSALRGVASSETEKALKVSAGKSRNQILALTVTVVIILAAVGAGFVVSNATLNFRNTTSSTATSVTSSTAQQTSSTQGQVGAFANGGFETGNLAPWQTFGGTSSIVTTSYQGSYGAEVIAPNSNTGAGIQQSFTSETVFSAFFGVAFYNKAWPTGVGCGDPFTQLTIAQVNGGPVIEAGFSNAGYAWLDTHVSNVGEDYTSPSPYSLNQWVFFEVGISQSVLSFRINGAEVLSEPYTRLTGISSFQLSNRCGADTVFDAAYVTDTSPYPVSVTQTTASGTTSSAPFQVSTGQPNCIWQLVTSQCLYLPLATEGNNHFLHRDLTWTIVYVDQQQQIVGVNLGSGYINPFQPWSTLPNPQGAKQTDQQFFSDALTAWSSSFTADGHAGFFKFTYVPSPDSNSPADADMTYYVPRGYVTGSAIGYPFTYYTANGRYQARTVIPMGDPQGNDASAQTFKVIVHETGHMFGLGHDCSQDLTGPSQCYVVGKYGFDDVMVQGLSTRTAISTLAVEAIVYEYQQWDAGQTFPISAVTWFLISESNFKPLYMVYGCIPNVPQSPYKGGLSCQ